MAEDVSGIEDLIKKGLELYKKHYGEDPTHAACAPGRTNLIGEHVDYNDGFVLPMALPMITVIIGKANNSSNVSIYTAADVGSEDNLVELRLIEDQIEPGFPKWANYIKGILKYFKGAVPGFNAVIVSSVPMGSGLSSSAALEVAAYTFLEAVTNCKTNLKEKAIICQKAEHDFAGVPCGIMDQFIAVNALEDHALFLDCKSLETEHVPLAYDDVVILITNSGVCHYLNSTNEYAERKAQCLKACEVLGVDSLRDAKMPMLLGKKNELDDLTFRRARHVISEIERTARAAEALKSNDCITFGKLMNESHLSLRDDYNVSCPDIDQLVEISLKCEGVFGARITGAGFGGCIVSLLKKSSVNEVIAQISNKYKGNAKFFIGKASGGACDVTHFLLKVIN